MKTVFTKVLLLALCLSTLMSVCVAFASCNNSTTNNSGFVDDFVDDPDAPELPKKKFNDNFVILGYGTSSYYVENAKSGDIVEYEMYMRNVAVEEKYGIKIVPKDVMYHEVPAYLSDLIKANDSKSVDLILNHIVYSSHIVTAGNALDWTTVPYINMEDEWWPSFNTENLMLNGKIFIATNDFASNTIARTPCMYFNKSVVEEFRKGDIYEIVEDGAWTYEKMLSIVTGVEKDLDGDSRITDKDLYGLRVGSFTSNTHFVWGFDNPIFSKDANTGELECTFYSKKLSKIAKDLVLLYYRTEGVYYDDQTYQMIPFAEGKAMFAIGSVEDMMTNLRSMSGWGIVPLPKFNSKQATYKTILSGGTEGLIAPKIGGGDAKLEKLGVVLTDLSYRSHKTLRPTVYDKALKGKYADDVSEAKMVDTIYENRIVDFGYIYMAFEGPTFILQGMLSRRDDDVEQSWRENKPVYEQKLTEAYAAFGLTFEGLD